MSTARNDVIAHHFNREAGYWDAAYGATDVTSLIYQSRLERCLDWVDALALPTGVVLDLGSGAGQATVALAQRGFFVEAIDVAATMPELVRRNAEQAGVASRIHAETGDAHALLFDDQSFDLAVSLGMLPWVPSPPRALAEVTRVLRPGAHAILSFANRDRLTYRLDPLRNQDIAALKRPLRRLLERRGWWRSGSPEPHLVSIKSADALLAAAGLRTVDAVTFGYGPFTLLGRRLFSRSREVSLDRGLRHVRLLAWSGSEYLVLVKRR